MSQTAKSGVMWTSAISASSLTVKSKIHRKTTAIYGRRCSIPLQPNPPEYIVSSPRRRKRSASKESEAEGARKDGEEGASRDGEEGEEGDEGEKGEEDEESEEGEEGDEGAGNHGPKSTLKSFEKVLPRGAIHSSGSGLCRLFLPRAFCERYNVENHVTMRDSTGHKLWHMCFQLCGIFASSRPIFYGIGNGWREFSYDHSLKVNDRLVFTLLSTSDFLVEFATQNGSTRAMLPTRDHGGDYPWEISKARLDCTRSNANDVQSSQIWREAMEEKVIRKNMAPIAWEEDEQEVIQKCTLIIPPEYIVSSSYGRERSASKKGEEGTSRGGEDDEDGEDSEDSEDGEDGEDSEDSEDGEDREDSGDDEDGKDGEDGEGNHGPTSTLISFAKVLAHGAIHTAECCRLSLPRAFCDRNNVESHVTMTDSTGRKLWQMRLQSWGTSLSSSRVYAITNGWREFSYDHSLKVNDRLVFTLLSTSQFLVEFATSNDSTRAMLPTRDGEDYPWKINFYRLECLSYANNVDSSQVWQQAMLEKAIRKSEATATLEEEDVQEVIRKNIVSPITLEENEHEVIRKNMATNTSEEDEQEELRALSGDQRESLITSPNKQQLQEIFCQCDTAKVGKGMNTRKLEYVISELTHLECTNVDGSSYLQILDSDSDSEMT